MSPLWAICGSVLVLVLSSVTIYAAPKAPKPHPERLKHAIPQLLADPRVDHAHWGISVTTLDGKPIYTLDDGRFFEPASNAKLFTTAAAMAVFLQQQSFSTEVHARGQRTPEGTLAGDLILIGNGDANFCGGHKLPYEVNPAPPDANVSPWHCLEELAGQVAKSGIKTINGNIIGDDSHFAFEPYGTGWSQDDLLWGYGAPVSALTIHDNQLKLTITPAVAGGPATVALEQAVAYYTLDVSITTSAAKTKPQIGIERMSGSRTVRVFGSIPAGAHADVENLAIADPAEYAAMVFKQALEARGISVSGVAVAEHNQIPKTMAVLDESRQPLGKFPAEPSIYGLGWSSNYGCSDCGKDRVPMTETTVASVSSPPILEDIVLTNKVSQNLHAELLLRQLGMFAGTDGSFGEGARVVRQFLVRAGVNPNDFVFYDGSGLSRKDMVTPRAVTTLLRYAAGQPWFADWKSSLPIGGVDGSLKSRFPSAPLKGNLFAKTGSFGEDRALSGYVVCASGRTVVFSIFVNDHMPGNNSDRDVMDKIAAAIAAND